MTSGFWEGKRVFLTGHTGFKGAWLSLWLQRRGAEVNGYSLPSPTDPSLFALAGVAEGMRSVQGDVRDLTALQRTMQEAQPEVVIHMAAQALVRPSYDDPVATYATNVMGTVHLLEAVRHTPGVRAVVVVTTDKCYENREWVWGYRETEPMGGHDPYSNSKGCAELVTDAYRRSYFSKSGEAVIASGRAGNVIGGGDWATDRLMPDMMKAFALGQRPRIRNPKAIRPWQHVLEPLHGYLALAEALCERGGEFASGWNFGPDDSDVWPVSRIADGLASRWGSGAGWDLDQGAHPHEALSLRLDCSKARYSLGWRPVLPLEAGLDWTVEWYRGLNDGRPARDLTLKQIEKYEALLKGNAAV